MKIYTITCHDNYNYGASLQAYALMNYLEECGHDVQIIDYLPKYCSDALDPRFKIFWFPKKWNQIPIHKLIYLIIRLPFRFIAIRKSCKSSFKKFNKKYLKLTTRKYENYNDLKNKLEVADVYIAGSDQIWNTQELTGQDPAFYLDFAPNSGIRISYAASLSTSKIAPGYKKFVKDMVEAIDYVSVRETEGVKILNDLGISNATRVIDPVFLRDKVFWSNLANQKIERGYILVYAFGNDERVKRFVLQLARKHNLKIYSALNYHKTPYSDVDFYDTGPEGFLSLIKNADIVVGNSLHGLAFSLIFEREFYVFRRQGGDVNSRLTNLLNLVELDNRLDPEMSIIDSSNVDTINYDRVNKLLLVEIQKSRSFLSNAIL